MYREIFTFDLLFNSLNEHSQFISVKLDFRHFKLLSLTPLVKLQENTSRWKRQLYEPKLKVESVIDRQTESFQGLEKF